MKINYSTEDSNPGKLSRSSNFSAWGDLSSQNAALATVKSKAARLLEGRYICLFMDLENAHSSADAIVELSVATIFLLERGAAYRRGVFCLGSEPTPAFVHPSKEGIEH